MGFVEDMDQVLNGIAETQKTVFQEGEKLFKHGYELMEIAKSNQQGDLDSETAAIRGRAECIEIIKSIDAQMANYRNLQDFRQRLYDLLDVKDSDLS